MNKEFSIYEIEEVARVVKNNMHPIKEFSMQDADQLSKIISKNNPHLVKEFSIQDVKQLSTIISKRG